MGRPSKYSPELADSICARIEAGEAIVNICKDDAFPGERTVYTWLEEKEDFRQRYARARERQADLYAAQIIELADKCRIGTKTTEKGDGSVETVTADMVERSRLQIDARKWYASKLAPKKWGDKLDVGVTLDEGTKLLLGIREQA